MQMTSYRLANWARSVANLPPRESVRRATQKILRRRATQFTVDDVRGSKYLRSQRMTNFLWRYEQIVRRRLPAWSLRFTDARVLEIGGGPLLGWGPYAVFFGCTEYVGVEPWFNPELPALPEARAYFEDVHADLSAIYGERCDRASFLAALRDRVRIVPQAMESCTERGPFHLALSNSTLEHIQDIDGALATLDRCMAPESSFLHLVDFGNHRTADAPLRDIFTLDRAQYHTRFGRTINLLRMPELVERFRTYGWDVQGIPYVVLDPAHVQLPPQWRARYAARDLLVRVGIIVGSRGAHR